MKYPGILNGHLHFFKLSSVFGDGIFGLIDGKVCRCGKRKISWGWDETPNAETRREAILWRDKINSGGPSKYTEEYFKP